MNHKITNLRNELELLQIDGQRKLDNSEKKQQVAEHQVQLMRVEMDKLRKQNSRSVEIVRDLELATKTILTLKNELKVQ